MLAYVVYFASHVFLSFLSTIAKRLSGKSVLEMTCFVSSAGTLSIYWISLSIRTEWRRVRCEATQFAVAATNRIEVGRDVLSNLSRSRGEVGLFMAHTFATHFRGN